MCRYIIAHSETGVKRYGVVTARSDFDGWTAHPEVGESGGGEHGNGEGEGKHGGEGEGEHGEGDSD